MHGPRLFGGHAGDDTLQRGRGERWFPREHFKGDRTQRIDVGPGVDTALAHRLFRRHVVRRTEREPRLRHALTARVLQRQRDAEVRYERMAALQQNVLRLDVAMDHATLVGVLQRIRHFTRNAQRVIHRELTLPIESAAQRLAVDERHHVEQLTIGAAAVEQRQDVRMLQRGGKLDLLKKPLRADDRTELGMQQLDRHVAPVTHVLGQIHGRHAALPELAFQPVAISDLFGKAAGARRVHGTSPGSCEPRVMRRAQTWCSRRLRYCLP